MTAPTAQLIDAKCVKAIALVPGAATKAVIACDSGLVALVDLVAKEVKPIAELEHAARCLAFLPDGRLMVGGDDSMLRILSKDDWAVTDASCDLGVDSICHVAVKGNQVLTASSDMKVRVWTYDAATRRLQLDREIVEHTHYVTHCAWHPKDHRAFAVACSDTEVRLFNAESAEATEFRGHDAGVNCVSFSDDGKLLYSAADDKTVKIWRARDMALLNSLDLHTGSVHAMATVRGIGSIAASVVLLTTGEDGKCHAWRVDDGTFDRVWSLNIGTAEAAPRPRWQTIVERWTAPQLATWLETKARAPAMASAVRSKNIDGSQFATLSPALLELFTEKEADALRGCLRSMNETLASSVAGAAAPAPAPAPAPAVASSDSKEWEGRAGLAEFNTRAGRCWCIQPYTTTDGQQWLAIGTDAGLAVLPLRSFAFPTA